MATDRYAPTWDAPCPFVPDGASEWERQEIRRHWTDTLRALDDATANIRNMADRLLFQGRYAIPDDVPLVEQPRYDHRMQGGGLTYHGMQAEAHAVALARVLDGTLHRLALEAEL